MSRCRAHTAMVGVPIVSHVLPSLALIRERVARGHRVTYANDPLVATRNRVRRRGTGALHLHVARRRQRLACRSHRHGEPLPRRRREQADAFVTHTGMGGCGEGILAGVPVIAVLQGAEQFMNADRLVELGFARRVDTADAIAETLRAALNDVAGCAHLRPCRQSTMLRVAFRRASNRRTG